MQTNSMLENFQNNPNDLFQIIAFSQYIMIAIVPN